MKGFVFLPLLHQNIVDHHQTHSSSFDHQSDFLFSSSTFSTPHHQRTPTQSSKDSTFEITIRNLGGLLGIYSLTNDKMFLDRAEDLGHRLLKAFVTPPGFPNSVINLKTFVFSFLPSLLFSSLLFSSLLFSSLLLLGFLSGTKIIDTQISGESDKHWWSTSSILSEVGSIQLEFLYLSYLTGNSTLAEKPMAAFEKLRDMKPANGLYSAFLNTTTGEASSEWHSSPPSS
jgi:hypothetical protein